MYTENLEPTTFIAETPTTCTQLSTAFPSSTLSDEEPPQANIQESDFWLG